MPNDITCPACGSVGLKLHARYVKYHRSRLIDIVRILCLGCGTTHALIPSFSLPDSSHDTEDVEKYLAARELGQTRREAGAHFLAAGRDIRVLKRIERSFERCVRNWSAIFAMDIAAKHAYKVLAAVVVVEARIVEEPADCPARGEPLRPRTRRERGLRLPVFHPPIPFQKDGR